MPEVGQGSHHERKHTFKNFRGNFAIFSDIGVGLKAFLIFDGEFRGNPLLAKKKDFL